MGALFGGRYELVDPLGAGGGGDVWRAWDHRERRYVAAKVLRQVDASSLLRFMREQLVRVEHPHVLTPLGWAGEDERVLFTMPLVRGGSAATLVGDHGPLPPAWVATLLDQLLAGLEQVHGAGVVHRDVTPANLLLDATGSGVPHGRLSDFGLATTLGGPRLTTGPVAHGTPGYLAPEALEGAEPDPRGDLYGAGATAYQLLVAQPPQPDAGAAETLIRAEVPAALAGLVLDLLAPDPADRPESAAAARESLRATGLISRSPRDLGDGEVEVFDQVPDLPAGWTEEGPATPREHPWVSDGVSPVADRLGPQPATAGRGRVVLGGALLAAGLAALLTALVLALG